MINPDLERLLILASDNIACARDAARRGQFATATANAECARDLLAHFASRLTPPANSELQTPTSELHPPCPNA